MKMITCFVRPEALPVLQEELFEVQIRKFTVTVSTGHGTERGYSTQFAGTTAKVNLLKRVCIQIVVNEDYVEIAIGAILRACQTGRAGDGKIFITEVVEAIQIRTGERGAGAVG